MESRSLLRMSSARVGAPWGTASFLTLMSCAGGPPVKERVTEKRNCIQLVRLLAFSLSCTLPFKSYNVFRNCWVYYTPHLGVKQGRIFLPSGRGFVLAVSVCKKSDWSSKDWLLDGGPRSQGWGEYRDLSCSALICHELFQRFLDVIESRGGLFTHHGDVSSQQGSTTKFGVQRETHLKFC